jgi:non-specific serine/threonine protein kinase
MVIAGGEGSGATGDGGYPNESAKMEELIREIEENVGHHKALVFSQFTSMLRLIRQALEEKGIPYLYLDGSVPAEGRRRAVQQFQEEEDTRIFLISLKAGGVGLTLTAADYVYLVDPWWNPAAEQQAIDRSHRIGQEKKVFAYRMICRDSVEEKILQLQERKRSLAADLIADEAGFVKTLTREDVDYLFG